MPKLNPNEAPAGYVAVESGKSSVCTKCCFGKTPYCNMPCVPHERVDGRYVIFKRKPTKPIRKPREWMAWAFLTRTQQDTTNTPYICDKRSFARQYNKELEGSGVFRVKIMEVL